MRRSLRSLPKEMARAGRQSDPLCVAMLELDFFKNYNDERGHQSGDRLLKQSASAWVGELRESDTLARYGGEEFTIALPGCNLSNTKDIVERLRAARGPDRLCRCRVLERTRVRGGSSWAVPMPLCTRRSARAVTGSSPPPAICGPSAPDAGIGVAHFSSLALEKGDSKVYDSFEELRSYQLGY